jgi:hypothetical protein
MMDFGLQRTTKNPRATPHNVTGQPTVLSLPISRDKVVVASPEAGEALDLDMKHLRAIGEDLPDENRAMAIARIGLIYLLMKDRPQSSDASAINIVHLEEVTNITTGPVEVLSAETGETIDVNQVSIVEPFQLKILRSITIPSRPDFLLVNGDLVTAIRSQTCKTTIRHMEDQSLFILIEHG